RCHFKLFQPSSVLLEFPAHDLRYVLPSRVVVAEIVDERRLVDPLDRLRRCVQERLTSVAATDIKRNIEFMRYCLKHPSQSILFQPDFHVTVLVMPDRSPVRSLHGPKHLAETVERRRLPHPPRVIGDPLERYSKILSQIA